MINPKKSRIFGIFFKKKALHNCIICAVRFCLRTVILIQLQPFRVSFSIGGVRFPLVERLILVAIERKDSA